MLVRIQMTPVRFAVWVKALSEPVQVFRAGALVLGWLGLVLAATLLVGEVMAAPAPAFTPKGVLQEGSAWIGTASSGTLRISAEEELAVPFDMTLALTLAPEGRAFQIETALTRVAVRRDKDGRSLTAQASFQAPGQTGWTTRPAQKLLFWPTTEAFAELMQEDGIAPQTWHDQPLHVRVEARRHATTIWIQGRLVAREEHAEAARAEVSLTLAKGDRVSDLAVTAASPEWRYMPVDLTAQANESSSLVAADGTVVADRVPFMLVDRGGRLLDLRQAQWVDWRRDPSGWYEAYDLGPYFLGDRRMPMLQIPKGDYVAAHVLAVAEDDPAYTNRLTLRVGRYSPARLSGQALHYDFAASVPRASDQADRATSIAGRPFFPVRIPMHEAFAQDVLDGVLDIEVTKEIRLARRSSDPNRFRWRPLGLPSGVAIAAITFERSPLQMRVSSEESGHLFVQPQLPGFTATLTNITPQARPYRLRFIAQHADGEEQVHEARGEVAPGAALPVVQTFAHLPRGYHDLTVELYSPDEQLLLRRHTSFAVLPPDTRQHLADSMFGTTGGSGTHLSTTDPEIVGPLHRKLGLRYGMSGSTPEGRADHGVIRSNEFSHRMMHKDQDPIERFEKMKLEHPDLLPTLLLFHEDGISGPHATRTPDLFNDRPRYVLNEEEQKRFDEMYQLALTTAQAFRQHFPDVKIYLGNGGLVLREELYRHGFPADLFDYAGNESASFGRLPETQPPDTVANNASLWMDRQMLDAYGYEATPIAQGWEVTYPSTNPGNLSEETQAAYLIRHAMHSLAWELPYIRPGGIMDVANSYYHSNWGACGFFHGVPELKPKPAAVAIATMTRILDGARFERTVALGSDSLYGVQFIRPDGSHVLAFWTVRGQRPVTLAVAGTDHVTLIDHNAIEATLTARDGRIEVTASAMPAYLVFPKDASLADGVPGEPVYDAAPQGKVTHLATFETLEDWTLVAQRSPELENYNPLTPRRQGDFRFQAVAGFEGREHVVQVTPQPIAHGEATMPMYAEWAHRQGLELPGTPTEVGLWVNGNSSWGRIIFELHDASGQRWISIGAPAKRNSPWMADWLPKDVLAKYQPDKISDWNTDDIFGLSRINFDGWRYVGFPLPGQYPGEGYAWPANSQWRYDGDGVVHYPLTLTKLVLELPEKTLHLKTYAPAQRPDIYLADLVAVEADPATFGLKREAGTYQADVQIDGL